jgi:hypothetical protein
MYRHWQKPIPQNRPKVWLYWTLVKNNGAGKLQPRRAIIINQYPIQPHDSDFVAHIIACAENQNIQHPFPGSTDLCGQAAQSLQVERHKDARAEIQEITD